MPLVCPLVITRLILPNPRVFVQWRAY